MHSIPHFGIVSNVPLDDMHLVCLGVAKKLITLWLSGQPLSVRLPSKDVNRVSSSLESLVVTVPHEFARTPRSLSEVLHWKATEFRMFLLYTSPIVLKSVLSKDVYLNFLTLHVVIRILSCSFYVKQKEYIQYANDLITHFVRSFQIIYGKSKISHNVHNLLHVVKDVEKFGVLDNFSAFRFENYMSTIKNTLRKSEKPLAQLYKRYAEMEKNGNVVVECPGNFSLQKQHNAGPLVGSCIKGKQQFGACVYNGFLIRCNDYKNDCFMLHNGKIIIVENIVSQDNSTLLIGKEMKKCGSFYSLPLDSSIINIYIITTENSKLEAFDFKTVRYKMWKLPYKNHFVVFPLLHADVNTNCEIQY